MIVVKQMELRENIKKYFHLAYSGEPVFVSRVKNKNVVVISEQKFNTLMKAQEELEALSKRNEEYEQIEQDKIIIPSMDEVQTVSDSGEEQCETFEENTGMEDVDEAVVEEVDNKETDAEAVEEAVVDNREIDEEAVGEAAVGEAEEDNEEVNNDLDEDDRWFMKSYKEKDIKDVTYDEMVAEILREQEKEPSNELEEIDILSIVEE